MKLQAKNIPNALTICRMVLTLAIVLFLLLPFGSVLYTVNIDDLNLLSSFKLSFLLAGILFVIAVLTDWIDGYLARKFNWVSDFGKLWDPIADKVLINSVLICFLWQNNGPLIPIWVVIIMIVRDMVVDGSRIHASSKGIVVPANIWGKIKTVTQMIGTLLIFFVFSSQLRPFPGEFGYYAVQNLFIFIALFFSILSGVIYVRQIYKKPQTD